MEFSKKSGTYRLFNEQFLPISVVSAWKFFSNPSNLQIITPEELDFKITSLDGEKAYSGQIITYSIKLNKVFKMNWVTEITHVNEGRYFVDEQRFGPYKLWHHLHKFEAVEGGVLITDIVHFKLPFPLFQSITYKTFVKRNLKKIFTHRESQLDLLISSKQLQ
ncbi:MAG: ligand-binding SRPBCC domain-containing protein [Vicingaceae bacterium]|jgi:ligand-binding SRPBCC domain-containing protein